jgi:hypothetical protein
VDTKIKYKPTALNIPAGALEIKVQDYCNIFSKEKLEKFGGSLDMFELSSFINNIDASIRSNSTNVSYVKRFVPTLNVYGSYIFDFAHSIQEGSVKVTNFKIADTNSSGYTYSIVDEAGVLSVIKTNGSETIKLIDSVGRVDYDNGIVSIDSFKPNQLTDIYAKVSCSSKLLDDQSMVGVRNSILKIDHVQVTLQTVNK